MIRGCEKVPNKNLGVKNSLSCKSSHCEDGVPELEDRSDADDPVLRYFKSTKEKQKIKQTTKKSNLRLIGITEN